MIPDQRHHSDPFACHKNLPFPESSVCFRRGSSSLVEMLRCRTRSLSSPGNPSCSLCLSQDVTPANCTDKSEHVTRHPYNSSAQNLPLLSPLFSPIQHFHHDSARHLNSPLTPPNLHPPSELRLSVPLSPQPPSHCKACTSHLLSGRTKEGRSVGYAHMRSFSTSSHFTPVLKPGSPTPPYLARTPPFSLPPHLSSLSPPPSHSNTTLSRSPAHLSPPSQILHPWSVYEGGDLTLLNHCLHHIVSRRTSSPSLSTNHSAHSHQEVGGTSSTRADNIDKMRNLNVPFYSSLKKERHLLFSPYDSEGRTDQLVG